MVYVAKPLVAAASAAAALILAHTAGGAFVSNSPALLPRPSRLVPGTGASQHHHHHHHRPHTHEAESMVMIGARSNACYWSNAISLCSVSSVRPPLALSGFSSVPPPPLQSRPLRPNSFQSSTVGGRGTAQLSRGIRARGRRTATRLMSMKASGGAGRGGGQGESTQNRALGAVVYLLPILDGLECGHDVFNALPMLGDLVHAVLAPALAIWDNVPFLPVVMFVILQVSVRRQGTSRFIRFNVQQAILVDILTVVLGLLGTAAGYFTPDGEQFVKNFAFYCLVGAVVYGVVETARGRMANQIPLISAAAEIQLGPS